MAEHLGMHHAAAEHFEPAGVLAHPAAASATDDARDVHLGRGFGKRKVRRAKAQFELLLEKLFQKISQNPLQVRKRHGFVHHQPLDLMEHGCVGYVRVAAVYAPGGDDLQRRRVLLHVTHLHRRGVRAQQPMGVKIEGVVHRPRRMVRRNVERLEVVVVVLDFRAVGDVEAHAREQCFQAFERARDRMQSARTYTPPRQRDVNFFSCKLVRPRPHLELFAARRERRRQCLFGVIDQFSENRPLLGRQVAKMLELFGKQAFLAEVVHAQRLDRRHIRGCLDACRGLRQHLRKILLQGFFCLRHVLSVYCFRNGVSQGATRVHALSRHFHRPWRSNKKGKDRSAFPFSVSFETANG